MSLERAAQSADVGLERVGGARRRPLAPQRVDQRVGRNDLVGVQEQERQQSSWFRTANRQWLSATPHLERTQKAKLDR